TALPHEAALKFLPLGILTSRQLRHLAETVQRERRARTVPDHPGLVRTYEILTVDDPAVPELDGCVVLVMERAVGTVASALDRRPGRGLPDAPRLIAGIAEALAHLHAAGWVHGDVKPSNVLLMADGSVRLTDFGLAAELDGTHGYQPPLGSADYLPPEAATAPLSERGRPTRTTGDVWALGVTAYQMLTGHHPFPGGTPRARNAAAAAYVGGRTPLPSLAVLPEGWAEWVGDCLAPTHTARARNGAASLAARAAGFTGVPSRFGRARRRRRVLVGSAAALAVVIVVGVVLRWAVFAPQPEGSDVQWLRTGVGIPTEYRDLIVRAGTSCDEPQATPALIAALLKTESDFDANLSDPARDEYGIARWTPRVLRYHLPAGEQDTIPQPPFPPDVSIPAVGRFLCRYLPELAALPGDHGLLIAAGYQFNTNAVLEARGVPPQARQFVRSVAYYRNLYDPRRSEPRVPAP
ncbi:MAG: hypothetical protein QG608_943, partial [Actinomycetota bacterium]|nr:hypothetical protein [Actinomycetota bacterium]